MKLGKILKSKKFRNICVTLIEILVVAAVIMGILLTVQSKLKKSSGTGAGNGKAYGTDDKQEEDEAGDEYYIEVNIKKNAVTVYQYNKDKSDKKAIKAMSASIGKEVKADKYKIKETYTWFNTNKESWNKYNVRYTGNGWIQSADYTDKYSWTLDRDSYEAIGTRQSDDSNIKLYAGDAQWIFENCPEGTVVKIVKGKKKDKLPLEITPVSALQKHCAWDPTDNDKGNPYKKIANGAISLYDGTVYIEKGTDVNYYANIIALDEKGKNITKKLKFDKFDSSEIGNHKVTYTYTTSGGKKLKAAVKYKVIDTTVPKVTISKSKFTYEVASASDKDLKKASVKTAIEKLVRASASASEGTIKVTAFPKEQLVIGDNYVRVVAVDAAGNVGSAEAIVEIKVKEKKLNKKYNPNKNKEKTTKKKEKTTETPTEKETEQSENVTENNEQETEKNE